MTTTVTTASEVPLLVGFRGLAKMLSLSGRQVQRLDAGGHLPRPLLLGIGKKRHTGKRWRITEIDEWLRARCPDRSEWELQRKDYQSGEPSGV